jgi:hypothetical protein
MLCPFEEGRMRTWQLVWTSCLLTLVACGERAPSDEPAEPSSPTATAEVAPGPSEADRAAILAALSLGADASGRVTNECGELVTPRFLPAEVGLPGAILLVMEGGPNAPTCYGDGPGLHLLIRDGTGWREIYASRGGFLVIMPTSHNGARDLVFGGPGMAHPTYRFDGTEYQPGDDIDDAEIPADAVILPN